MSPRLGRGALAVAAVLALGGCGPSTPPPRPTSLAFRPPASYLHVFPSRHAMSLLVVAGARTGGFDLDGTEHGAMRLTVPLGWRVTVTLRNLSTLHNSLALVAGPSSTSPVLPGAAVPAGRLRQGIPEGASASFTFRATRPGLYRLASLVPGHETSGMWALVRVAAGVRPSLALGVGG